MRRGNPGDIAISDYHTRGVKKILDITIRHPTHKIASAIRGLYKKYVKEFPDQAQDPWGPTMWPGFRGPAAHSGEADKLKHYVSKYHIRPQDVIPVAIDTYGYMGTAANRFFVERFGKDDTSRHNLYRVVSVAVQRGNAQARVRYE